MSLHHSEVIQSVTPSAPSQTSSSSSRLMGAILVDAERLSIIEVDRILSFQDGCSVRFGDAGQALGLLTQEDVRYALSLQFDYPYLPDDSSLSRELVAAYEPASRVVEDLRALRSQLMLRWFDTAAECRGLAIASAGHGDGRSYLAANLAIVFSQLGERTLLIDANLRTPKQHKLFNLGGRTGLSDMLVGRASSEAIVGITALRDLSVLPAGTLPPNPQELLGRHHFSTLLRTMGESFDVVIIDTPAASAYADAHTVAVRAGAALLVARQGLSSVPQMAQLTQGLRDYGVKVLGSVLNNA
jgi:chain length determinant protein tyrosine kinase EpsG